MKEMPGPIPNVACQCAGSIWVPTAEDCVCGVSEATLRAWMHGVAGLPPMTEAQRAWALDEISSVEGYSREYYENSSDDDVARGVLDAWTDFCRDKGLL
jgi:hypothetical protein